MIDVVRIEEPRNCGYPFSEALYGDSAVVYHGTSSTYAASIETDGLVAGAARFPVQTVQQLVAACDAVGFKSWSYTTVKGLSRGTDLSRAAERRIYLSANFWFARDYATNTGGETVHNALHLADELLRSLRTSFWSGDLAEKVTAIRSRLTTGSFPIVYALRVDPEWLERKGKELERQDLGSLVGTDVNLSCRCSIPPERLLAKAEYVNGAESGYLGPQPRTWEEARRWPGGPTSAPRG